MPALGIDGGGCYFIDTKGKEKGMKKRYEKPQVYMEKFELAEHIAGCKLTLHQGDVFSCDATGTIGSVTLPSEDNAWFAEKTNACEIPVEDYCYTNSTSSIATINS